MKSAGGGSRRTVCMCGGRDGMTGIHVRGEPVRRCGPVRNETCGRAGMYAHVQVEWRVMHGTHALYVWVCGCDGNCGGVVGCGVRYTAVEWSWT